MNIGPILLSSFKLHKLMYPGDEAQVQLCKNPTINTGVSIGVDAGCSLN